MSTTAQELIPAVSLDALLAARDTALAAFAESRRLLREAREGLRVFGARLPDVKVSFPRGDAASLEDADYARSIEQEIDRHVWVRLFELTNIDTIMDHKTRNDLFSRLHQTRYRSETDEEMPALTRENIEATLGWIHGQQEEFFEKGIEAVYRSLSWEHRTNEPTRIGERLIINHAFYTQKREWQGDAVSLNSHESLHDLERVLCLLDGQPPPTHGTGSRSMGPIPYGQWTDVPSPSGPDGRVLLRLKVFRKGTTHVQILNSKHVDEMNLRMARRFPGAIAPPQEAAQAAQAASARRPTVALARTEKQARQAFYTPAELADKLVENADVGSYERVLEPSAGEGAIVRALLRRRCERITAIENDPHGIEMLGHLARRVNRDHASAPLIVVPRDFFDVTPSMFPGLFDAVVMNPPFSAAQEVEHVLHAWEFVKPGGVLVSVMSGGAETRRDGRYAVLTRFLVENGAVIERLPDRSFEEAGTGVATVLVTVRKPGGA